MRKFTRLTEAIYYGRDDLAERLISEGEDVNESIPEGRYKGYTPLTIAIMGCRLKLISTLIEQKADCWTPISEGNIQGQTPMSLAVLGLYQDQEGVQRPARNPLRVQVFNLLVSCGLCFDNLALGESLGKDLISQRIRKCFAKAAQLFEPEDQRMSEHLGLFSDFLADTMSYGVQWDVLNDGFYYLRVRGDSEALTILTNFLSGMMRISPMEDAEADLLYIHKLEVYRLLNDFANNQKKWLSFYDMARYKIHVEPELKKLFIADSFWYFDAHVYVRGNEELFSEMSVFLKEFRSEIVVDDPLKIHSCVKISLENLLHHTKARFAVCEEKMRANARKFILFRNLALACGSPTNEKNLTEVKVFFELGSTEVKVSFQDCQYGSDRFVWFLNDYFPRHINRYPYVEIWKISEENLSKMLTCANELKAEDLHKPENFKRAVQVLVPRWKKLDDILFAENVMPECVAVFARLQKLDLPIGLVIQGRRVQYRPKRVPGMTKYDILQIEKTVKNDLEHLRLFAELIRKFSRAPEQCGFYDEGIKFLCKIGCEEFLHQCLGPILEKSGKMSLIRYEKIMEISPGRITALREKIEAEKSGPRPNVSATKAEKLGPRPQ